MDGFTYTNIFETKGIEYLVIIAFLLLLIPFWLFLNKKENIAGRVYNAIGVLTAGILKIPQGLFYSRNHTWAYMEKTGNAKIGLDEFILRITGNVRPNFLKQAGEKIMKGEVIAEIVQNGKRLKVCSPISGEIMEANSLLDYTALNEDPYGSGWLFSIKPLNWKDEINSFFIAAEATKWATKELVRFKDFLAESIGKNSPETSMITLQDGGELRQNILSQLDNEIWHDFQETFMK